MTLTTPPVDCPYSASKPPVLICTSCTKSYGVALPSEPKMIEYEPRPPYPVLVTFVPSTTYWFSRPEPPEIDGFIRPRVPELLTPGARYITSATRRPTGRSASSSVDSTAPIVVVDVSTALTAPVTCTTSVTPPTSILRDRSAVLPRLTATSFCSTA